MNSPVGCGLMMGAGLHETNVGNELQGGATLIAYEQPHAAFFITRGYINRYLNGRMFRSRRSPQSWVNAVSGQAPSRSSPAEERSAYALR